jgi:arylsulfatase A-like enzyme
MKRREFLKSCAAFAAAGFIASSKPLVVGLTPRPNIVFIYADDWGYGDLSCHGHPEVKTPNIDRLAAEGTDFSLFTVNNPVCSPSRTAIMTGKYPARFCIHQHFAKMGSNRKRGMPDWLDPKAVQLPRLFKESGYVTGHFGKWHLTNASIPDAPAVSEYGYDEWLVFNHHDGIGEQEHYKTAEAAVKFIRKHKDKPFFVNLWLHETHVAHFPTRGSMEKFAHLEEQQQVYYATVTDGDNKVGAVLAALDELGLSENTLVIFSSDNGPENTGGKLKKKLRGGYGTYYSVGVTAGRKGRKRSLFHGGTGTAFIVRWPGKIRAGKKDDKHYLTAVDMLPTLSEAAGIKLPAGYESDGESRLAVFLGKDVRRIKPIYWEWRGGVREHAWPRRAVVRGEWKLVGDDTKTELYKLRADESEQNDFAAEYPKVVNELSAMWEDWKAGLPTEPAASCISKERK